ncbi:hypothetical protein [Actinokineospora iranica]|nr:hypothetical protein [Actinokineospora iranica]
MTTALVLVALSALVIYGLDRNHAPTQPRYRPVGSSDVEDRDLARVAAEVRTARPVVGDRRAVVSARRGARVRPASAIR